MPKKRELPDKEYLEAKPRAARIKRMGDGFETLIIMLLVIRGASFAFRGKRHYASMRIRQFSGEFVDDIKVCYPALGRTRFIHAKSGRGSWWDQNLVRDFKSQRDKLRGSTKFVFELWVRSPSKKREMRATLPPDMPNIHIQVLSAKWSARHLTDIPHVRKHLPYLIQGGHSERQIRKAWSHIETSWRDHFDEDTEVHEASVSDVMEHAHDLSLGAVRSLQPTNADLAVFVAKIGNIRGLNISADGETLVYWSNEFGGRFGCDPKRVDWPWLQKRLRVMGLPRSLADFAQLIGAVQ